MKSPWTTACLALLAAAGLRGDPAPAPSPPPAGRPATPALIGQVKDGTYVSPTGAFKVPLPIVPELGGTISDTDNVVTFDDGFTTHLSIAAFAQDAMQRWELTTRGPKDYLIYFFTTFVMPDFLKRFPGASVSSARFFPTLNDGTLLAYTLLPGGSALAERVTVSGTDRKALVAKRGNLLFVKGGFIFVISSELAEHVLNSAANQPSAETEDELLRQRLIAFVGRMEFPAPANQKK